MIRILLVVALFLVPAVQAENSSLGGVTISNVKTDLSNLTISYTITNTTDKALNGWGIKIGSFYGVDALWSTYYADRATSGFAQDGAIEPGGHRDLVARLQKVPVRSGEDLAPDMVVPTSGDVVVYVAIFEDNRAFGPAKTLDMIEKTRSFHLALEREKLEIIAQAKQAPDPQAYLKTAMENLPQAQPESATHRAGDKPEETDANWRLTLLHSFLQQVSDNLTQPGTNSLVSLLDTMSQFPAVDKAKLEGHTKLIRDRGTGFSSDPADK